MGATTTPTCMATKLLSRLNPSHDAAQAASTAPKKFVVVYYHSCDGGRQEASAATRFIQQVAQKHGCSAQVEATCSASSYDDFHIIGPSGKKLFQCNQKQLYQKYRWPAEDQLKRSIKIAFQ